MDQNKVLSIDEMLAKDDKEFAEVQILGGTVRLGSVDAGTMLDFLDTNEGPSKKTAAIRLIIKSLVDKDGNRIGKDEHLAAFKLKSTKTISTLVDAITKLNGVDKKDLEAAGKKD